MKRFLARHAQKVIGVLHGWDRLVFRGTIRMIAYAAGMKMFLSFSDVLLKNFAAYAMKSTSALIEATRVGAERLGRPWVYLQSSATSKEDVARRIAEKDGVENGLIAILACIEPCFSFDIHRNRATKMLELVMRRRKCQFLYHYMIHPVFGFMHARIQTWFPFNIQICINGREWLARQMKRAGIGYERRDNCFARVDDVQAAQRLLRDQVRTSWPVALGRVVDGLNPARSTIFGKVDVNYYLSVYQSEWATDIMFRDAGALASVAPALMRSAISTFSSGDVMRFLGRRIGGKFAGEIVSDFKNRPEGARVKHSVGMNSVKMYDKQASVLRVETTLNEPKGLKSFRAKEGDPDGKPEWRQLRKGIADIRRWTEISHATNDRYLDALSAADVSAKLGSVLSTHTKTVSWKGKRVRGLRPWSQDDVELFRAVSRGEFTLNGFRNSDLQKLLFAKPTACKKDRKLRSARVTRLIRMLRAHGLVSKIARSHRYRVSDEGRKYFATLLTAQDATLQQISKIGA